MISDLLASRRLKTLKEALEKEETLLIEGLWDSPKALVAAIAAKASLKHVLILTARSREEARLFHDFPFFIEAPVIDFPAWETLPSERVAPSPDIVGERYEALNKILDAKSPLIILSNLQAALQKVIAPDAFRSMHFSLKKGDSRPFDELIAKLEMMGYTRRPVASDKGEFAVRGGIIDIFPVSTPDPYRLEFWGNELESIRIFDPIGQKSLKEVEEMSVNPAQEMELLEKTPRMATLLEYLGPKTLVIFDDLLALEDRYANLKGLLGGASSTFQTLDDLLEELNSYQKIYFTHDPIENLSELKIIDKEKQVISFNMFSRSLTCVRWPHLFLKVRDFLFPALPPDEPLDEEDLLEALNSPEREDEEWHILCSSLLEKSSLEKKIAEYGITLAPKVKIEMGYLSSGFVVGDARTLFFPMTEVTHRYKLRRQKQRSTTHTAPTESYELNPGDMIVHINHGIGRYLGMERRANHMNIMSEFFVLEYAEGARVFVPLNQAALLTKYIGTTDETPRMHEIGSTRWKKAKERTQQAIMGYASDLLELYAKREIAGGIVYPPDSIDMEAFEEDFPYDETKDQLDAISSVKQDMCSQKSMDRLICGDVGYGKTEVAMRAAFKAVVDGGKQVAVLVPTTVLAMQHFENFKDRMRHFPVRVGVLSRFVTPKEIQKTLQGVTEGTIDIVVGTHRIISEDVKFKNLGLVIIDEEQRFGVKTKEHLRQSRLGVDCLTLSATPIPRTLYLSIMGARDLSVINTPPQDRLPIKTVITQMDDNVLKNALQRELSRDGQAYVIHNRVETIYNVATRIKKLLPDARVIVGHGQMTPHEIDEVFHAFKNGLADILVATSIVENGIDIPNANTILIDRADLFGLADLYQLRGRVGRWNRQAYAYFLIPNMALMPEITRKRLLALAESSGYGGGMKVAMRDLEIRGAGNVLGIEQSGQVETIGFHQYCKWLKRAIQTLQGKLAPSLTDAKVECKIDARLPEDYVNEVSLRMEFYQRLGEALALEEVNEIGKELLDRFGELPKEAEWLLSLSKVRVVATQKHIHNVIVEKVSVAIEIKKGKETETKRVMFSVPNEPKAWEEALIRLLSQL